MRKYRDIWNGKDGVFVAEVLVPTRDPLVLYSAERGAL